MATISSATCAQCLHVAAQPLQLKVQCGHTLTFCEMCIQQVKKCPKDGRPIVRGFEWRLQSARAADGQVRLESSLHKLVKDAKIFSSSPLEALPPLDDYADYMQTFIDRPRDVFPRPIGLKDYVALRGTFLLAGEQAIDPQTRLRAGYYYAIVEWSQQSPRIALEIQKCFGKVAEAGFFSPKEVAFSRFTQAYMELNQTNGVSPRYAKALEYLALVETDQHALPVHCAVAKFYIGLFFLKSLGGLAQSYKHAKERLIEAEANPSLPKDFNRFSRLMLAEMHLFGLGGTDKNLTTALILLQDVVSEDSPSVLRMVKAKALYWMGLLYQGKVAGAPQDKPFATTCLQKACALVGIPKQLSDLEQMQTSLEANFRSAGGQRPEYLRDQDNLRGPLCESWLSLHLDLPPDAPSVPPACCVIL